jgi:hypothetical protein
MTRSRSPLRLVKKKGVLGHILHVWACDARFRAAEFQDRYDPRKTAIVHGSTKKKGFWQTSFFDERGPAMDIQSKTCAEAMRELPYHTWRLRNVK